MCLSAGWVQRWWCKELILCQVRTNEKMSEVSLTEPGAGGIREKWDYLGQTVLKRYFKKM